MKKIHYIHDMIDDHLELADDYAEFALEHKHMHRQLADEFARFAEEELAHIIKLYDLIKRIEDEHSRAERKFCEAHGEYCRAKHAEHMRDHADVAMKVHAYKAN